MIVEAMKNSMHLAAAVLNVSALVQISYILNFEWIHRYNDKVATNQMKQIFYLCTFDQCMCEIILHILREWSAVPYSYHCSNV